MSTLLPDRSAFAAATARRRLAALTLPLVCLGLLAACSTDPEPAAGDGDGGASSGPVEISAQDDACDLSSTELTAGITTFAITNSGSQVTEVYVYDNERIVTEKENIGPGTSYELTVDLIEGAYQVACKPGMVGDGIRTDVTVAAADATVEEDPLAAQAVADYREYVQAQADKVPPMVQALLDAIKADDREAAMAIYAPSREPWEAIEPVAESFGDLDPRIDIREADLEEGQEFTGWHRIEKALWTGEDLAPMVPVAEQLLADVNELAQRVPNAALTAVSIGNGSKELLDEVATGKITGEEEAFSHTDLVDFDANLAGAKKGFEVLRPLVEQNYPELAPTLDTQFAAVEAALAVHASGDGYVSYDTVQEPARQTLARAVDGLGEPLSNLAAAAAGDA